MHGKKGERRKGLSCICVSHKLRFEAYDNDDVDGGWNEMECWLGRVAAGEYEQDVIDCT